MESVYLVGCQRGSLVGPNYNTALWICAVSHKGNNNFTTADIQIYMYIYIYFFIYLHIYILFYICSIPHFCLFPYFLFLFPLLALQTVSPKRINPEYLPVALTLSLRLFRSATLPPTPLRNSAEKISSTEQNPAHEPSEKSYALAMGYLSTPLPPLQNLLN